MVQCNNGFHERFTTNGCILSHVIIRIVCAILTVRTFSLQDVEQKKQTAIHFIAGELINRFTKNQNRAVLLINTAREAFNELLVNFNRAPQTLVKKSLTKVEPVSRIKLIMSILGLCDFFTLLIHDIMSQRA
ncbi:hypothetical protein CEXT_101361 [Caerostris extrusa]|uniref:Uncharacterized protein n=1 Tax=Caerostris extrusa TaxID=172846 RepID=A0AAV4SMA5_CAEEX|nr:hypothetical protein CEXT_101361 [Caerostris extrusa]